METKYKNQISENAGINDIEEVIKIFENYRLTFWKRFLNDIFCYILYMIKTAIGIIDVKIKRE